MQLFLKGCTSPRNIFFKRGIDLPTSNYIYCTFTITKGRCAFFFINTMCGINGIIGLDVLDGKASMQSMNSYLSHRGPDASGIFSHEKTHLGHTRLSILDLSNNANQPLYSEDKNYAIVYNGEVYNFEELKEKHQITCSTTSDTEVLLKLFILKGTQMFTDLNGMFSIAIHNKKEKSTVIARDRIGIKPLFIYQDKEGIAFSSELNALKGIPEIKNKLNLNKKSITSFLHLGYIPAPNSIYEEITKFPSGCFATYHNGKLNTQQYWSPESKIKKEILSNENQAIDELDKLLNDSINIRLKADVPFGTFLSGGIDSSIVTAIAQAQSEEKINSFSIGFKEKSHNEAVYAKEIANKIGTNHHEFIVDQKQALELIPDMFSKYGEPYADSSAIPMMLVSKLARSEVKMTLSGDGGDELFHGYGFYNWAKRLNNPLVSALKKPISMALSLGDDRMKRASEMFKFSSSSSSNNVKSHVFSQEQYYFSENEIKELVVNPQFDLIKEINQELNVDRKLTAVEKQSLFDIKYYLQDELLVKVDIASMSKSLEDRVPLLDHRIIEFALNLDPVLKIKNGEQKYILKQVLYKYMPPSLFDRPKQGFSIPLSNWLKNDLKHLIIDFANENIINKHGIVKWNNVKEILTRFESGENYLYTRIWAIIVLHNWLESNT